MNHPDHRARRLPTWLVAVVFAAGLGHSLLYAFSFPPWAIEDEQQHVDYTWRLAFEQRVPQIEETVDESIVESVVGTERWKSYDQGTPSAPSADALGLQARSYAAYHPPLHYALTAPVAWVVGDRALVLMYALRMVSGVLAGTACALTAWVAWRWAPTSPRTAALVGGLALAGLPALADSGGRHNADLAAAAAVLGVALACDAWARAPGRGRAAVVASLLAAAVLTRETALVAIVPIAVAATSLHRRGQLRAAQLVGIVSAGAAALVATLAIVRAATGSVDGSRAFLDRYGVPYPDLGVLDVARALARHALLPYGQWSGTVTTLVVASAAALAAAALWQAGRTSRRTATIVAWGSLGLQLAILLVATARGLNLPTARLLLPSYPLLAAWLGTVFAGNRRVVVAHAPAIVAIGLGAVFFLHDLAPRYPFRLG